MCPSVRLSDRTGLSLWLCVRPPFWAGPDCIMFLFCWIKLSVCSVCSSGLDRNTRTLVFVHILFCQALQLSRAMAPQCLYWICFRCSHVQRMDIDADTTEEWVCDCPFTAWTLCKCGGSKQGHSFAQDSPDGCTTVGACNGRMSFCPSTTSTFGGGLQRERGGERGGEKEDEDDVIGGLSNRRSRLRRRRSASH